MNDSSGNRHWKTILELSEKMMEVANQRDWSSLEALTSAREKLIAMHFTVNASPADGMSANAVPEDENDRRVARARIALLQKQIEEIRAHDLKVMALIGENRERLSDELRKLQEARRVVAYMAGNQ